MPESKPTRAGRARRTPGLIARRGRHGTLIWHIDKRIRGHGRLCESTAESDLAAAERYLAKRIEELRELSIYGRRPRRRWQEALQRYLIEFASDKYIKQDEAILHRLEPYLAERWLDEVHTGTLEPYFKQFRHLSRRTLLRNIAPVRRILRMASRWWREKGASLPWLAQCPPLEVPPQFGRRSVRRPYPLDWAEEPVLLGALAPHLRAMAQFNLNTGLREQELCSLRWSWEQRIPELETDGRRRTVFVLPAWICKNREPRVVMLNDIAQAIVDSMRGIHPVFVFTYASRKDRRRRDRLARMHSSGWKHARRRASLRYEQELGRAPPDGFRRLRVHDLRHTFGRRLRAAGVPLEDRRALLGHKSRDVTVDYSAPELAALLAAVNRIVIRPGQHGITLLRLID